MHKNNDQYKSLLQAQLPDASLNVCRISSGDASRDPLALEYRCRLEYAIKLPLGCV